MTAAIIGLLSGLLLMLAVSINRGTKLKIIKTFLIPISFVLSAIHGCSQIPKDYTNYNYSEPQVYNDNIRVDKLSHVGMDSTETFKLTKQILNDSISNIQSLLIVKDNKLVYENYFAGKDQKLGKKLGYINHSIDQLHDCRSISKSVVGAFIGTALKNKVIGNIDDPIKKYFPEIKDSVKAAITINTCLLCPQGLNGMKLEVMATSLIVIPKWIYVLIQLNTFSKEICYQRQVRNGIIAVATRSFWLRSFREKVD